MTEKLDKALEELDNRGMGTRTGAAMAGKQAIRVLVKDLPPSPERADIVATTGAAMEEQLKEHSNRKGKIDEDLARTLSDLDEALATQPSLAQIIEEAKTDLGIE